MNGVANVTSRILSLSDRNQLIFPAYAAVFLLFFCGICPSHSSYAQTLQLNDLEYFETPGVNVLVFSNQYTGFFFDEKTAGIELIHHGVRTSTGGAIRLQNTPEQWDLIPTVVDRKVDASGNSIEVVLRYEEFDFDSRVNVRPEGDGFVISVYLDDPVPRELEGNAGFNLEFLPASYFERTYLVDGKPGIFPLYPSGNTSIAPVEDKIPQFAGHTTFNDRGRGEFIVPEPLAKGNIIVLAPEDPERHVRIQSQTELMLSDGRSLAQNGWFVVRSLLPANRTGRVLEWYVEPNAIPDWVRKPVIGFSQVGYHPKQEKIAVIELDKDDTPLDRASLYRVTDRGTKVEVLTAEPEVWGGYMRYNYVTFDFTSVDAPGLYFIQYGDQTTNTFVIDENVYEKAWHPTLDVFFPVQMDHMSVKEAYRTWHGISFMDDALQAPVNHQHFDGYSMGPTTDTKYEPYERIPGLAVGGWYDAGDFDIQTGTHNNTILHFVNSWERFRITRDQTFIDQQTRHVDIHRPDGKPDLLQQIEHGVLNLVAQIENIGHPVRGIVVPNLHQYYHLGDGSTSTDNLPYNSDLEPYETDGLTSGTMDDRWAFTNRNFMLDFSTVAALAAANRALKDYNDELSEKCLVMARNLYDEAFALSQGAETADLPRWGRFSEINAVLQLYISTNEDAYGRRFEELIWPTVDEFPEWTMGIALQAVPHLGSDYKDRLRNYVVAYKDDIEEINDDNPYGVPIAGRGWGGNARIVYWAIANYFAHTAYPEIIGPEYVFRGLNYLFGCHPYSNISFVSAVGTRSKKVAYGSNRADFSFIAGGVVPGLLLLEPDFPENKEDWPFLWGQNEYVIDIGAAYIFLVNAAYELTKEL
jgi:endoglucanase